jgi:signal transduction histidine kinase
VSTQITDHRFSARRGSTALAADLGLALLVGLVWWALADHQGTATPAWTWLIVLSTIPVARWRVAPVPAFVLSVAAAAVLASRGAVQWPPLAPLVALYLLTASRAVRARGFVMAGSALLLYVAGLVSSGSSDVQDVAHAVLGFAVAWFAGERSRLRQEQIASLHDRLRAAAESKAQEARLAVAEERSRIARDLHDSAGHAINVIAVRAGGARLREDPARAFAALADIERIARDTAADVDAIVGALRDRDEPRTPVGLAAADSLIAQHRASGLEVTARYDGDLPALSPAGDQAAFRALQEALTNAARHGTGSVDVRLSGQGGRLQLIVSNPTGTPSRSGRTAGRGLIGMQERAGMLGGTLDVERPPGHFVVRLTLPGIEATR